MPTLMDRREFLFAPVALAQPSPNRYIKCICSVVFPESMPLPECFRRAKSAGFEAIEIRLGTQITLGTTKDELKRIHDAARDAGIAIASLWPSLFLRANPINSPDPAVRDRGAEAIRKSVEFATSLECDELLIVPGGVRWEKASRSGYQDTWDRTTAALKKVVPFAEQSKVTLGIENLNNRFLLSPLEMRTYVEQFRSPSVQCHFDVGNGITFSFPQDWILTLGKHIRRVHLKDFKSDKRGGGNYVPLTEGDIDWKEVMAALVKTGYQGFIAPEIGYDEKDPGQLAKISLSLDKILALA
jgi:L-ribulose-5-phosphate 3-epimerase